MGAPDEETLGVTRRQFFNRSIVSLFAFSSLGLGRDAGTAVASGTGGFGGKIRAAPWRTSTRRSRIAARLLPRGLMWVTAYPSDALPKAEAVYSRPNWWP